jgi:hypothetical protein
MDTGYLKSLVASLVVLVLLDQLGASANGIDYETVWCLMFII